MSNKYTHPGGLYLDPSTVLITTIAITVTGIVIMYKYRRKQSPYGRNKIWDMALCMTLAASVLRMGEFGILILWFHILLTTLFVCSYFWNEPD